MKKILLTGIISILFFFFPAALLAQSNQTVANNTSTTAVTFTGDCLFNWTNDTPTIGLAASGSGNIPSFTAVNTGSSPVTATITVTPVPVAYAYVANSHAGTVSVINTATNAVVNTINVGLSPVGATVSPDNTFVYVINAVSSTVSVISTVTNAVVKNIPVGLNPDCALVNHDGSVVYVSNASSNTVSVINASTNVVVASIAVGKNPAGLSLSPDGTVLYVVNENPASNSISFINTGNNTVTSTYAPGIGVTPTFAAISNDGSSLYIDNYNSGTVSVINTATHQLMNTIPAGTNPSGLALSADGTILYVVDQGSNKVSLISTATGTAFSTITVGASPDGASISQDGKWLYVVNNGDNTVSVINTQTNTVATTIPVGAGPAALAGFFVGPATPCPPVTFTITVNPTIAGVITAGTATGSISACAGTASVSPAIQQFTVSGNSLSADITATAPANFEISLAPGSGYGNTLTLAQNSGAVANTVIYVRSAASATAGNISGNVTLSSVGSAAQMVSVSGKVSSSCMTTPVPNQTVSNGAATAAVNFPGTSCTYTWTNDTPGIGLAASGTGNIASFTAVNTGSSPVTATITATPVPSGTAYIANYNDNTISVINTGTHSVVSTIAVGPQASDPYGSAVSKNGSRVYTSNYIGTVSQINTVTGELANLYSVGNNPRGIAVSPDGSRVYVANLGDATMSVINTVNNTVAATISVGSEPWGVTISPDGSKVYVVNFSDQTVSVINTASNTVVAIVTVGSLPSGIAIDPNGNYVYVTNGGDGSISIINTATNTLSASVSLDPGSPISGAAVSPDGRILYVSDNGANAVLEMNTATNALIATVPVGATPEGISVSPDGSEVYVANSSANTVSVINTGSNTVVATINVGASPESLGSFIAGGAGCNSMPVTFTMTVNPGGPVITAGTVTGSISACAGTASSAPNVQQFTVSGVNLTGNITATAPTGFEVSLAPGGGYGNSVVINQSGGVINNNAIYIRSSAAASGNIAGTVTLASPGASAVAVPVSGIVKALPAVNAVTDQTVVNGSATTAVNFTGTANLFNWVNDTPGIGLAASGTGNIASFTAVNTSNAAVKATIAVTPITAGIAYITNYNSNTVSVFNTATNMVTATIPVGSGPEGVTVAPDGSKAYVVNHLDGTVSVINTASNTVIATITTGIVNSNPVGSPDLVAVSPDGSRAAVTDDRGPVVSIINTSTNTVVATIPVDEEPKSIAYSPDGSRLYVVGFGTTADNVLVINTNNNAIVANIPAGLNPFGMVVTPDGSKLYVTNLNDNTVSVISTVSNTVITTIPVGTHPYNDAISADGSKVYVTNVIDGTVSVINTANNTVITTIPVGFNPEGISVTPDGSTVYVGNTGESSVSVINASTNTVTTTVFNINNPVSISNITGSISCSGTPATFTITVNPTIPFITATGTPSALSTVQGTASTSTSFTVSGSNITDGILVTPPNGFEASTDGVTYSPTVTVGAAGTISPTPVYIRLSAGDVAGSYGGNVILSSTGATNVTVAIPQSTVTVPVTPPAIAAGFSSGSISACAGTASASPNIEQITVSGNNLSAGITVTAPAGFEVSTTMGSGYGNSATISPSNGNVSDVIIFVRSAAGDIAGNISGNVVFASPGAADQSIAVTGIINALPTVNAVSNQTLPNGAATTTVNFTGTGNTYSWVNDTPGIGLPTSGTGNISSFTATNNGESALTANLTITPSSAAGCTGTPVTFTITVNPSVTAITETGTPTGEQSIYGTASPATSFNVAGSNLTGGILVTAPAGFEVSTNNVTFTSTVTVGSSGAVPSTPVYLRLAASSPAGNYAGNIILSSPGAANITVAVPNSVISPAALTITAADETKTYGATDPVLKATYNGFVNGDTQAVFTTQPSIITPATSLSGIGTYPVTAGGAMAANYAITYVAGTLTVTPAPLTISADDQTKAYGAVNPTLTISYSGFVNGETSSVFATQPTISTTASATSPAGIYPITITGAVEPNYSITYLTGKLTVTQPVLTITADDQDKVYGAADPPLTVTYSGFVNGDTQSAVTTAPVTATTATAASPAGNYPITASGAAAANYMINYVPGTLTVTPAPLTVTADDKTKAYGADVPALTVTYSGFVGGDGPAQLTVEPAASTTAFSASPPGQYPITVSGGSSPNYTFNYINGVLTVTAESPVIAIPNTFTPNGDGINDTWDVKNLISYINCTVEIYNRYGENVYSSIGYGTPWDGTYKGARLPSGTYYYIINLKNGSKVSSGFVAIIR